MINISFIFPNQPLHARAVTRDLMTWFPGLSPNNQINSRAHSVFMRREFTMCLLLHSVGKSWGVSSKGTSTPAHSVFMRREFTMCLLLHSVLVGKSWGVSSKGTSTPAHSVFMGKGSPLRCLLLVCPKELVLQPTLCSWGRVHL